MEVVTRRDKDPEFDPRDFVEAFPRINYPAAIRFIPYYAALSLFGVDLV